MRTLLALIGLLALSLGNAETNITYQGQLQDGSGPFTGTPGMGFRLFDSLTDGNQIGDPAFFTAVPENHRLALVTAGPGHCRP